MSDPIERIWRRLLLALGRGRITFIDDAGPVQKLQVKLGAEEVKDNTPRLSEYGFQSVPPAGSDAVVIFIAGERTNGVVVATGNQTYRMRGLASGEVAISDDKGQHVYLSAAGIRVDGGGKPIEITNTPSVLVDTAAMHVTGSLQVDGDITSSSNVTAAGNVGDQGGAKTMVGMRTAYNAHKHGSSPTTDHPM
jgi:phage baseplate assembly protein V